MKVIRNIAKIKKYIKLLHLQNKSIGFVPTMGFFHKGHLSLMKFARRECDVVVVSLFVNPTQFGINEDYKEYPRNFNRDRKMAEAEGVDVLFYPGVKEMYPHGYSTYVDVKGNITECLCGKFRRGHFTGVATIVTKLFNIVTPDIAYFGQKDAQQCVVIKKMVSDLNMNVKIKVAPIVREKDGLAMSSRNTYLSKDERKQATILYKSLKYAKKLIEAKEKKAKIIVNKMLKFTKKMPMINIEYIEIVNYDTLEKLNYIKGRVLIALAARVGRTRLIDNVVVNVSTKR